VCEYTLSADDKFTPKWAWFGSRDLFEKFETRYIFETVIWNSLPQTVPTSDSQSTFYAPALG